MKANWKIIGNVASVALTAATTFGDERLKRQKPHLDKFEAEFENIKAKMKNGEYDSIEEADKEFDAAKAVYDDAKKQVNKDAAKETSIQVGIQIGVMIVGTILLKKVNHKYVNSVTVSIGEVFITNLVSAVRAKKYKDAEILKEAEEMAKNTTPEEHDEAVKEAIETIKKARVEDSLTDSTSNKKRDNYGNIYIIGFIIGIAFLSGYVLARHEHIKHVKRILATSNKSLKIAKDSTDIATKMYSAIPTIFREGVIQAVCFEAGISPESYAKNFYYKDNAWNLRDNHDIPANVLKKAKSLLDAFDTAKKNFKGGI